jgi:surface protein
MPTITFNQLEGAGILNPDAFDNNQTYNITVGAPTCSGSAYFTMEAVRNENGFYDGSSAVPAKAKFLNFVNISQDTLIENILNSPDHIWSVVIPPGGGTFDFVPFNQTIFANTVFLRGTGGITFTYGEQPYIFQTKTQLQFAVNLWITDNTAALATYGEINTWVTTAITDMANLFDSKTTFNSNISNWDVSNVTTMQLMFNGATSFNQPINNWRVINVVNMSNMFNGANAFQQPLNLWELLSLTNGAQFMGPTAGVGAITYNLLDTLYNGWAANEGNLESNVTISFGNSTFTAAGLAAKNILVNTKNWTITDGGQV